MNIKYILTLTTLSIVALFNKQIVQARHNEIVTKEYVYEDEPGVRTISETEYESEKAAATGEALAGPVGGVIGGLFGGAVGLAKDTGNVVTGKELVVEEEPIEGELTISDVE